MLSTLFSIASKKSYDKDGKNEKMYTGVFLKHYAPTHSFKLVLPVHVLYTQISMNVQCKMQLTEILR